ncbi:hypothetical protein GCM10027026_39320 [Myroides odoratimimus subsp. xuanwuensis]
MACLSVVLTPPWCCEGPRVRALRPPAPMQKGAILGVILGEAQRVAVASKANRRPSSRARPWHDQLERRQQR